MMLLIRANLYGLFSNRIFEDGKEMLQYENQITRDHKQPLVLEEYLRFLQEGDFAYERYKVEGPLRNEEE